MGCQELNIISMMRQTSIKLFVSYISIVFVLIDKEFEFNFDF